MITKDKKPTVSKSARNRAKREAKAQHRKLDRQKNYAKGCYIYGLTSEGALKIGITFNPSQRLRGLKSENPSPMFFTWKVLAPSKSHARTIEKLLHQRFNDHRVRREWFSLDISSEAHKMAKTLLEAIPQREFGEPRSE